MKSFRMRFFLLGVLCALAAIFIFQHSLLPGLTSRLSPARGLDLLGAVMGLIKNDYLEERAPVQTTEGAFRGLVNSLDPLSCYLNREATAKYLMRESGSAEIGAILFKRYGLFPQVVGIVDGSPAAKAGLKPGDLLSALDGHSTLAMSYTEVNLELKGLQGKAMAVKVIRGNTTLEVNVGRDILHPARFTFVSNEAGPVLSIHNFFPPVVSDIKTSVVPKLRFQKKPLVLDLRNCYEGEWEEAREFVNLFLKADTIGVLEKKNGIKETVACPKEAALAQVPLIVWINPATMGPGEFAAGVLQELRKAKVIGAPTPGLAARQEQFPLQDQTSILVTTAIFTLPSKKKLWGQGISPDVALPPENQSRTFYLAKTKALIPGL